MIGGATLMPLSRSQSGVEATTRETQHVGWVRGLRGLGGLTARRALGAGVHVRAVTVAREAREDPSVVSQGA